MGDRFRLGELLAAIGAVGLTVMLLFGTWLTYSSRGLTITGLAPGAYITGGLGVRSLGWFVALLLALAAIAGLAFLARVLTSTDTERPALQAPIAFAAALIAFPVLGLRLTIFQPDATDLPAVRGPEGALVELAGPFPASVTAGAWLGLLFLILLMVGTWVAMDDERTDTPTARQQTDDLLGGIPRRPVPAGAPEPAVAAPAASLAASDAEVSAQDAAPTEDDPTTPPEETS
jgi:hypothetical protein